jgi:hypothetical protein|tara:strand:- start:1256 stop:1486 length:231 start_codon:yes stop_codon:yes gene_type:complete
MKIEEFQPIVDLIVRLKKEATEQATFVIELRNGWREEYDPSPEEVMTWAREFSQRARNLETEARQFVKRIIKVHDF